MLTKAEALVAAKRARRYKPGYGTKWGDRGRLAKDGSGAIGASALLSANRRFSQFG